MAKADAVEVDFTGGERSATRFANSTITANMVQFDQQVTRHRLLRPEDRLRRRTREFDDESLKEMVDDAQTRAEGGARQRRPAAAHQGAAGLPAGRRGAARAVSTSVPPIARRWSGRASTSARRRTSLGSGYIPKVHQTTCTANSEGLFAYYQYAEAGFILTCRTPDGGGSGWAGITGVKDVSADRSGRAHRSGRRQGAEEPEAARARAGTLHRDPRAAADGAVPVADDGPLQCPGRRKRLRPHFFTGKETGTTKVGEKLFSESVTIKSDIGNPILRQTPIGPTAWRRGR